MLSLSDMKDYFPLVSLLVNVKQAFIIVTSDIALSDIASQKTTYCTYIINSEIGSAKVTSKPSVTIIRSFSGSPDDT